MEINITDFVRSSDPAEFSASAFELGRDAGTITWNNAKQEALMTPLLAETNLDEFKTWIKAFGSWDEGEIASWGAVECNALLIQFISGSLRELESTCYSDDGAFNIDWDKAQKLAEAGTISGDIYKVDDNVYFYMGN